jgi:hypothetical protein
MGARRFELIENILNRRQQISNFKNLKASKDMCKYELRIALVFARKKFSKSSTITIHAPIIQYLVSAPPTQ